MSGLLRQSWRLVLVLVFSLAMAAPASAQGFGWLGGLFGGGTPHRSAPAYPGFGGGFFGGQPSYAPRVRRPRHKSVVEKDAPPAPAPAPKKNPSVTVDVFGDSMGQVLANGLDDALSDRDDVGVYHDAKGSTGLVATSFYDWPKAIETLLASEDKAAKDAKDAKAKGAKDSKDAKDAKDKGTAAARAPDDDATADKIDVAVIMIGANDRQPITEDGKTYPLLSDEWTKAYTKRVLAIDQEFQKRGIPLIWVGLPITKDGDFANDMAAFNDIFRETAAKTGAVYVDTWEAFSDDNGAFSAYGPDIDGQTVKLRLADGVNFTRAGARKLAHFVEAHVRRALDGKTPPAELPTADAPAAGKPVAAVKPDVGPIVNLNEPLSAAHGELAAVPADGRLQPGVVAASLAKGLPPPAPKGRADDFRWPGASAAE